MISNPFLDPTQGNSIGEPAVPGPDRVAFQQAMMQRAQEDAVKYQLQQQGIAGRQQLAGQGIGTAGRVLGTTISSGSLSSVAPVASVAGMGLGVYEGSESAGQSVHALNQGIGTLSPTEEAAARQKIFDQGMDKAAVGSFTGSLGGLSLGPVGAVVGGLAGAYGGLKQGYGAYDTPGQGFQAFTNWARNPFKR